MAKLVIKLHQTVTVEVLEADIRDTNVCPGRDTVLFVDGRVIIGPKGTKDTEAVDINSIIKTLSESFGSQPTITGDTFTWQN